MIVSTRLKFLSVAFCLYALCLFFRLFYWQIISNESLTASAKDQQLISSSLPAERGTIYAADSFPLSSSTQGYLAWASLPKVKNPLDTAQKLAPLLVQEPLIEEPIGTESAEVVATPEAEIRENLIKLEEERLTKLLTKSDVVWVALKKKLSKKTKEEIEKLNLEGIGFNVEETRVYPEGSMASHLLGFVGLDAGGSDKGYFGLEGYYNLTLEGSKGTKAWEKDASGMPILVGENRKITALNGLSLKTHIDRSVQFILEKHLKEGVKKYQADGGTITVMRPQDGAIIGLASFPSYQPERFNLYSNDRFIDPAVSQSFEPGSIFKVLVMAWGLDSGAIKADDTCDNCAGPRHIAEYTIESGTNQYYPNTTMGEIIQHSDNVGMVWTAEKMGFEKFYEYLTKFGFGSSTGVDLQGEVSPRLRPKEDWSFLDLATASFGQGIAVTSVQMVKAVSAIANGGYLPTPQVVDSIVGEGWEEQIDPIMSEQVISEKAAREITEMMVNNVDSRPDWKKPEGIKIAGKTGTAQVAISGHYDPTKTVASFIGFAPATNPEYVMLVSLKDPKAAPFASQTAAPLWFDITQELLPILSAKP